MSGWPKYPLGELCNIAAGGTPSRSERKYFDGSIPWVKIGDMLQSVITHTEENISDAGLANSAAKKFPVGTVLISIFATIGRTAVLGIEAATNQAIAGVTPKDSQQLNPRFLRLYFDSLVAELTKQARGVAQLNINLGILRSLSVPLPSMAEQRRIAAILDQAETLRTQRRAALAQLDSLTQSIFLDMFGDPERFEWPLALLGDIVDEDNGSIRTGPFGSQLLHSEFVDEGIAVLGIDNAVANEFRWGERRYVTPAKYQQLKRYTVRPGDVLITIMGTCGRCAVVPDDIPVAINTKHLCCISVDRQRMTPIFLHTYFLQHPIARKYLEQTAKGAIMSGLNLGIIKAMPIPVPPLPLQQTFATRIQAIEALKATHRAALSQLDALFASLQQRAFAGQL